MILDNVGLSAWIGVYLAVVMVFMMCGPTLYQAVARKTGSVRVSLLLSIGAFVVFFVLFVFAASTPVLAWCFAPIIGVVYGWYVWVSGGGGGTIEDPFGLNRQRRQ